jgi:hypothetical protein
MRIAKSPIAETAVRQIAALYAIEAAVRGHAPELRLTARRQQSMPIIEAMKPWPGSDSSTSLHFTSRESETSIPIQTSASRHDSRQEPYAVIPHVRICAGGVG